jgi:23S rRNA (cytosine1962-C5)-methyltransferase
MTTQPPPTTPAPLRLKKNEDRRLRAGHLWVYSNEVDVTATPLDRFEPGQPVLIQDHREQPLGTGYVNPRTLICARLVNRDTDTPLSASLIAHRLKVALTLRERLYLQPCYRLVHGESDQLPGLVVDRYGDVLVAQLTTAGMEHAREAVIAALVKTLKPAGILLRNDTALRALEGLPAYVEVAHGVVPERVTVEENAARFHAPLAGGQKTGWFYDHRDNRARLAPLVRGLRVLDVFSYLGAWGVQTALAGAREVLCVDSSQNALTQLAENATLNGVAKQVRTRQGDAFDVLRELREARERFDVVILDPPAFIKRRKDVKEGVIAYRRLNQMAMQVLARDGLLVSCSCSFHLERATLDELLLQSVRHLDRSAQFLYAGQQAMDHPVHPAIPETDYLKCRFVRVLPA